MAVVRKQSPCHPLPATLECAMDDELQNKSGFDGISPMKARLLALIGFADILAGGYMIMISQDQGDSTYFWVGGALVVAGIGMVALFLWLSIRYRKRNENE